MHDEICLERIVTIGNEEDSGILEDSEFLADEGSIVFPSKALTRWFSIFSFPLDSQDFYPLIAACITTIVSGFIGPVVSIVFGEILDSLSKFGLGTYNKEELMNEVTGQIRQLCFLGFMSFISNWPFLELWQRFAGLQAMKARVSIFEGLLGWELGWFDTRKDGVSAMLTSSQTRIGELETALGQPLGLVLQSFITSIACIMIAVHCSWKLTLAILGILPFATYIQYHLRSKLPALVRRQKLHLAEASKSTNRTISNIANVKCLNGEVYELGVFSRAVRLAAKAYRFQAHNEALNLGIFQSATLSMFVLGFWYGGILIGVNQINRGSTKPGDIMTATWSCLMAAQHFQMMVPHFDVLIKGKIAGAYLRSIMNKIQRSRNGMYIERTLRDSKLAEFSGNIQFSNVSFAYPSRSSRLALKNITLSIEPNKTTWIIGKSGSGKSTIGNLILKSYNAQEGYITFDGHPLESLDTNWLRENITLVQQHSVLFDDTVFQNIALGKAEAKVSIQQATKALFMAGGEDLVNGSDSIWDRMAGASGCNLSDGQKQRVSLARAILRDTPVLILDEAVSALDSATRLRVMRLITEWRKGRTTLIITHDITQIPPHDMVYFIKDGAVVESALRLELENKRDGYFTQFLQTSQASLRNDGSIPEDCELEYEINNGRNSTAGFSSRVETGSPEWSKAIIQELHPHGGMISPRTLEIPSNSIGTPEHALVTIHSDSREFSLIPHRKFPFTIWPFSLLFRKQKNDQLGLNDILLTIWPSLSVRYRMALIIGIITSLMHAAATPTFSFTLSKLIAFFYSPNIQVQVFNSFSFTVLVIAVVDGITTYTMHYCFKSVSQEWVDYQRNNAYRLILKQPLEWFEDPNNGVGGIPQDLEKHAEQMKELVPCFTANILVGVVMLVMTTVWCLVLCWNLTLVIVVITALMFPIVQYLQKAEDNCEEKFNSTVVKTADILQEAIENVATVKMMRLEGYFRTKYQMAVKGAFERGLVRGWWGGLAFATGESFILFALALILYYGTYLVAKKDYELHPILGVLTIFILTLSHVSTILGMIPQISSFKDTSRRVLRLSQLQPISHESLGSLRPTHIQGHISFNGLSFSYRNNIPVLENVHLSIPAHNPPLLITGSSGSGKTTLFKLLLRFYYSPPGTITLDDTPIGDIDVKYLREIVAIVPASPGLFDGLSVFENIAYGSGSRGSYPENVYQAARFAGIHDFIVSLPEGYDTVLNRGSDGSGSGGCSLSGGQAQRVAIARAVVRKPKVLILDEPSSALDVESERHLSESLRGLAAEQGMTIVVVTHSNVGGTGGTADERMNRKVTVSGGKILEQKLAGTRA